MLEFLTVEKMIKKIFTIFITTLFFTVGCAVKQEPPATAPEWELSSQAAATYYFLRSLDETVRGRFLESAAVLEKAVAENPRPILYIEMARSYWRAQDRQSAFRTMEEAVSIFPDEPGLYFFLAELYLADNKDDQAVTVLERYREVAPHDLDVYQDLASFYSQMGDYPRVLDLLDQVPEDRKTPEMLYYMGRASSELGDRKKALFFLRRAVESKPGFPQAWAEMAFIHERERDYLQAEEIYRKLLSMGERNPELVLRIIELNLMLNNPDKALEYLGRGPVDSQFLLDVANKFISNSFYSHAYEIIQRIREQGAYPPTVYFYLALIAYQGWSDPDEALDYLGRVPEEDAHHIQALSFSIQIYFEEQLYQEALDLAVLGRDTHPAESRFFLFEAIVLEVLEDFDMALETVSSALKEWPEDTDLLFRKGVVVDKTGDKDGSLKIMEEVIAIDQDHHEALNYIGYSLAEQNRDLDRALVLIERALSLDPANGYYLDSLAWVYYMQGDYHMAWKQIKTAVEFVDDDPIIWEHYGDIAQKMGFKAQAVKGYEMALENEPEDREKILEKMRDLNSRLTGQESGTVY